MTYESWVGLNVIDKDLYQKYREAMKPLLVKYGGGFRFDFWTQETLKADTEKTINRIFAIYFESKEAKLAFFADPDYKEIRKKYFEPAVSETHTMAEYERNS